MKTNMKMNPRINIKTNPSAKISSHILKATTYLCAGLTFGSLCYLILHILIKGIPYLKPSLFALEYTSENVSLLPALLTTILMVALALALAVPLGIFTAIYLVEYAKKAANSSAWSKSPAKASPVFPPSSTASLACSSLSPDWAGATPSCPASVPWPS